MKIQLKSGSNYEIVNSSGTTLLKVDENGQITGGGTKLYKHEILFEYQSRDGNGHCQTIPFHFICSRSTPITLDDFSNNTEFVVGANCVSLCDEDHRLGSYIVFYIQDNKKIIEVRDYSSDFVRYHDISKITDTVTPL